jgi:hypothetical protein
MELCLVRIRLDHARNEDEQTVNDVVKTYAHDPIEIFECRRFDRSKRVDASRLNEKVRRAAVYLFNLVGSSRMPLLRMEYVGGKLLILVSFLLGVTLLPAVLLLIMQVAFSGSVTFIWNNLFVIPAVVLASLMQVIVASFTMLALSSLSKSSRYVSLLYTGAIFFTEAMFNALRVITGSTRVAWISITANLQQVVDAMFRMPARYETPVVVSVLVLLALVAVSVSVLERRVKGVEVVS